MYPFWAFETHLTPYILAIYNIFEWKKNLVSAKSTLHGMPYIYTIEGGR